MHRKSDNKNQNQSTKNKEVIPDYSSKSENKKAHHPDSKEEYNEFAKELNPDDFE
ncbi:MAG: hypothetical protein N4A63_01795 [Vallitalea sp.]|jgi:uncharacterized short protein YbdD (DUF466 family)|nr:hypothetical protein [Vallitalea sp.]